MMPDGAWRGAGRPPADLAARQLALELAHVEQELALLAVEALLELGQLGAPALHSLLPQLDVRLELRLARVQRSLPLVEIAKALAEILLELARTPRALREPDLLR